VLPNFDQDRVYPSDIKKLILWYNLLVQYGITDFHDESLPAKETEEKEEAAPAADAAEK
jgi:hypothetical protein